MELDRGGLARIDRKLLAGLGLDETYRMVRVLATAAKWSTWKRYCDSAGIAMGRAIATLIDHELSGVLDESNRAGSSVLAEPAEEELSRRQTQVSRHEKKVAAAEERFRAWGAHLRTWEGNSRPENGESSSQRRWLLNPRRQRPRSVATNAARVGRDSSTSTATACPVGSRTMCCQIMSC